MSLERSVKRAIAPVTSASTKRRLITARDRGVGTAARIRHAVASQRLRPTLVIAGAQKAGTTFLHHQLEQHPDVRSPLTKELHFFDDNYARGIGWYLGHFPADRQDSAVGLESSPGYMFHPHAVARLTSDLPDARLILLLRNPVSRAFSQFLHERRLGFEPENDFERALDLEEARVAADLEKILIDPDHVGFSWRHHSYFSRGCYVDQVRRCQELAGGDRVHVIRSESMFNDPHDTLRAVHEFAGLTPVPVRRLAPNDMAAGGNERLDDALRSRLETRYAPHNEALAELLGTETWW